MGCVSYSRQFFPDGAVDAHQMKQAELAARREIEVIAKQYRKTGWKEAYGSSGTAKALYAILAECGRSEEHTSELQSLMRISYAVFCLKKKKKTTQHN